MRLARITARRTGIDIELLSSFTMIHIQLSIRKASLKNSEEHIDERNSERSE